MPTNSVQVLWTARYDYQPHWRLAEHTHEFFQMIYFLSGSGIFMLNGKRLNVEAGSLLLVKPRIMHAFDPASLVKTLDIKFLVNDRPLRKLLFDADSLLNGGESCCTDLFERIRREGESRTPFYKELCSTYLMEILLQYLRKCSSCTQIPQMEQIDRELLSDWIVQRATQYIRDHLADDCSLLEISRVVGRSDRHVRQHFKDVLGFSPRHYLLLCRIQKAQHLIEFSNLALKEIAQRVGFKTIHHFARAFHEISGETPGSWRKRYQEGICKDVNVDPEFVNTNWTVRVESANRNHANA